MTIKTGYVGLELHYLCHKNDEINSMNEITDELSSYIGCYPSVEELAEGIMEDDSSITEQEAYDLAYDEQYSMIEEDISVEKEPANLEDLNTIGLLPNSILTYDEIEEYKNILKRDENVDKLLTE
jgi:hypothetical protein